MYNLQEIEYKKNFKMMIIIDKNNKLMEKSFSFFSWGGHILYFGRAAYTFTNLLHVIV